MAIRDARPGDAPALSDLAERSKRHWGYDDTFIDATRHDIAVTADHITHGDCAVADQDGTIAGFYLLEDGELTRLFVEPEHIGRGFGRTLLIHASRRARKRGIAKITIVSDPNAAAFYEKMGALRVGEYRSRDIPGRTLPMLELRLAAAPHAD